MLSYVRKAKLAFQNATLWEHESKKSI